MRAIKWKKVDSVEWLDIGKRTVAITVLSIFIGLVVGIIDAIFGRTLIFLSDIVLCIHSI